MNKIEIVYVAFCIILVGIIVYQSSLLNERKPDGNVSPAVVAIRLDAFLKCVGFANSSALSVEECKDSVTKITQPLE